MPYEWVEPETFFEHGGVTVYHAYHNDCVMSYHYQVYTDLFDTAYGDIDIVDLAMHLQGIGLEGVPDTVEPMDQERTAHKTILTIAIAQAKADGAEFDDWLDAASLLEESYED